MRAPSLFGILLAAAAWFSAAAGASAQPADSPLALLDVPFIQQTEALCGGAAAAMVMRYWGATGIYAESFAPLVDAAARGIHGEDLLRDLRARGWEARAFRGDHALVAARLADRQPVVALIEDRPGYFHFVVIVAWTNGRVVYHDPARAPFRVVDETRFDADWRKSDRWTMLLLPGASSSTPSAVTDGKAERAAPRRPCDDLVAEGVRTAEGGDRKSALAVFSSAMDLCPASPAPLREAAGVHALEGNWAEAERLAREAARRDASDAHAWRIAASGAFLRGDPAAALEAWNAAGEPTVDIVNVLGLDRTRYAIATRLMGIDTGTVLTPRQLAAAAKRLRELPSAEAAQVNYRPLGGGRAAVEAVVVERPVFPTSRARLAAAALRFATDRELAAEVASPTGGGELIGAAWRAWRHRPRVELSLATPSRAGIWRAAVFGEEQSYIGDERFTERRRGGYVSLSQWTPTMTRWEIGAGVDAWGGDERTVSVSGSLEQRLLRDRLALQGGVSLFAGSFAARTMHAAVAWRSSTRHEGLVVLGGAGVDVVSAHARPASWPGAGTGQGREALLRAHPLLDDGWITGDVFGRRLAHGTVEVRRWTKPLMKVVRFAPAVFVDLAAADRRLQPGSAWHADAGAGLRFALPGSSVLRVDVGKGLRDGATALSVGWVR